MERIRLPEHVESKYQPLEDINDSIYFQRNVAEFNADDIKVSQFVQKDCMCYLFILFSAGLFQHISVFSIPIIDPVVPCDSLPKR